MQLLNIRQTNQSAPAKIYWLPLAYAYREY